MTNPDHPPEAPPKRAVFARISSRPIPRVTRMMHVASALGYDCFFLGALREPGLPREDTWEKWPVSRLGAPFPLLNGTRPLTYVKSIWLYNWHLFRMLWRLKPVLVHASDVETMPAAVFYKCLRATRLIYNIHDNVAQRYNVPAAVAAVMNAIEGVLVLCSDVSAVPENFRRTALPRWCQRKVVVIRNTPIDPGSSPPALADDGIRVLFCGWLDWGRGLRQLLEMASKTPSIKLRVAGEGSADIVEELRRSPNITCLGFLNHQAVLEETKHCHFVAALYDPARVINRFAASNKFAEALAVGRPVLVNCEMEVAKGLLGNPCLIAPPYVLASEVGERLVALVEDRDAYSEACRRARAVYDEFYEWNRVREQIRLAILGGHEGAEPAKSSK